MKEITDMQLELENNPRNPFAAEVPPSTPKRMGIPERAASPESSGGPWTPQGRKRKSPHPRKSTASRPSYKRVDTLRRAGSRLQITPYLQSTTREERRNPPPTPQKKVMILWRWPNRIGQGIEFRLTAASASLP